MYRYKHTVTQEIIEIADIVVDSTTDYFDSPYVEWWIHIDDQTRELDKHSESYILSDNGMFK